MKVGSTSATSTVGAVALTIVLALVAGSGLASATTAFASTVAGAPGIPRLGISSGQMLEAKIADAGTSAVAVPAGFSQPSLKTPTPTQSRILHRSGPARAQGAHKVAHGSTAPRGWRKARVSWYGPGFYGHTMAGGGKLTPTSMVVAHRSLRFGTKVEIMYRGRRVIAVVKDRGPYVSGRTFDLGPGTAKALGFSGVGTVSWRIVK
ncbi:MAG: septal ring lytic transglycosylase RlpA family protein [Coriobacteriales bacterium]|nr:septal ring lytic transglycosylase RlpA family protein [Actinomycetes bacterium]